MKNAPPRLIGLWEAASRVRAAAGASILSGLTTPQMHHYHGKLVARYWPLVILAWMAILAAVVYAAPPWDSVTNDGDLAYLPARMTSVRGEALLAQAFPDVKSKSQIALVLEREGGRINSQDLAIGERLAERFGPGGDHGLPVVRVWTPNSDVVGGRMISTDRHAAVVVLLLANEFMSVSNIGAMDTVLTVLDETRNEPDFPPGLKLGVTGSAAIGGDMLAAAGESIENTELTTMLLVVAILLMVYRAPLLVLVPITTIVVSAAVAICLIALLTQLHLVPGFEWAHFQIFKTTRIFIIVLVFGSGTDYCLFLISRYREELTAGHERREALASALGGVGNAVSASALTTILGLAVMVFAAFGKFRNAGPAIALCLVVALAASLTLAPALLRAMGPVVFWPFTPRRGTPDSAGELAGNRFWDWTSRIVMARPGLILAVSVLLMAPFAYEARTVGISYNLLGELQDDRPSVQGTHMMREHFPAGESGPITMLVRRPTGGLDKPEGEQDIAILTKQLYEVEPEGVDSVRSIAEPLGDRPGYFNPWTTAGRRKLAIKKNPLTKSTFLTPVPEFAGQVARFDIVPAYDPFSQDAIELVTRIDDRVQAMAADPTSAWHGSSFDFIGATAATRDLKHVTESDQKLIQRLVILSVFGILVVSMRRPVICAFLMLSVLFSYYVTIGATELLFGWLYDPFDGLDWKVPLFLFVILIAVGQDYNIYLTTRVLEEQKRLGPSEGLRRAVVTTGGIITSCGIIMAGSFVSMMTGTLRGMLELGFALTLGILLDTCIVRPILVPAFLALLVRRDERRAARASQREPSTEDGVSEPAQPVPSSKARSVGAAQSQTGSGWVGR